MTRKTASTTAAKPSQPANLVGDMQRLGYTEYEARTYISLVQMPRATAYEVSKHSGLPRANTYGALENLTKKQAVQPVSEDPVRYVAIPPKTLLDRVAADVSDVCSRLKDSLEDLELTDNVHTVWSIEGQGVIEAKINQLIDEAQEHVWIKASTDILRRHATVLKAAAIRGVKLIFVVFGADVDFLKFNARSKIYLHEGNGLRVGGADNLLTVAVDYRIALTANVADDLTGAYTTNPSVVRMAETLIRHDVYMAEMMSVVGGEIEARFGVGLVKLRRQLFSPRQLVQLETNIAAAAPPRTHASAAPAANRRRPARH